MVAGGKKNTKDTPSAKRGDIKNLFYWFPSFLRLVHTKHPVRKQNLLSSRPGRRKGEEGHPKLAPTTHILGIRRLPSLLLKISLILGFLFFERPTKED